LRLPKPHREDVKGRARYQKGVPSQLLGTIADLEERAV
jgi:hypothetical protein